MVAPALPPEATAGRSRRRDTRAAATGRLAGAGARQDADVPVSPGSP